MKRIKILYLKIIMYLRWLNSDFEDRYDESANERKMQRYNSGKVYYKI